MWVADALSRRYALLSILDTKLLGFEYIKDLYAQDSDFGDVFNACEKVAFGKFYRYDGMMAPKDIVFDSETMWIQLHNIPLGGMTRQTGLKIGSSMGEVVSVDVDEEGIGWGPYLRVQVNINITQPLMRGIISSFNGSKVWIAFQYERLPNFCFCCGIIKHGTTGCPEPAAARSMHGKYEAQYGA
ncbi:uncharacterized protein LOC122304742 [Carya illinoinensis]|uniref:uncharacterized protein LOC122304742 n=1 Tax=Carya illinoinensis TaxID=32201 RepID=UPI001C721FE6|nr:uncharacterized protein LOC122304742 [Carya illinoinensis]